MPREIVGKRPEVLAASRAVRSYLPVLPDLGVAQAQARRVGDFFSSIKRGLDARR
jgi:hypothetical protein